MNATEMLTNTLDFMPFLIFMYVGVDCDIINIQFMTAAIADPTTILGFTTTNGLEVTPP